MASAPDARSPRRFFLERTPDQGEPTLAAGEGEHAVRVLRLGPGDRIEGLDGVGAAWPLRIRAVGRRGPEVEAAGPPRTEPRPGDPGSPLPWIELAVAFPRPARAEAMVDRLVQLGVAAIVPLRAARTQGAAARELEGSKRARLERIAGEACKQSGRLWLPEIAPSAAPLELADDGPAALLEPSAEETLVDWARALRASTAADGARVRVIVGPEGGFAAEEARALSARAAPVRMGPWILRIETAAEAAAATLAQVLLRT